MLKRFMHSLDHWLMGRAAGCWHAFIKEDAPSASMHGPYSLMHDTGVSKITITPPPPEPLRPIRRANYEYCCKCGREQPRSWG